MTPRFHRQIGRRSVDYWSNSEGLERSPSARNIRARRLKIWTLQLDCVKNCLSILCCTYWSIWLRRGWLERSPFVDSHVVIQSK
ncbi:hypothetical protein PLICRDRAFT_515987 [Plicaturopsis crispa FD-325 SS-3]|nr:hypothetical protein PLICRDRAFT_515987 [Plicaturopsis crispa FD-325 SS-3]